MNDIINSTGRIPTHPQEQDPFACLDTMRLEDQNLGLNLLEIQAGSEVCPIPAGMPEAAGRLACIECAINPANIVPEAETQPEVLQPKESFERSFDFVAHHGRQLITDFFIDQARELNATGVDDVIDLTENAHNKSLGSVMDSSMVGTFRKYVDGRVRSYIDKGMDPIDARMISASLLAPLFLVQDTFNDRRGKPRKDVGYREARIRVATQIQDFAFNNPDMTKSDINNLMLMNLSKRQKNRLGQEVSDNVNGIIGEIAALHAVDHITGGLYRFSEPHEDLKGADLVLRSGSGSSGLPGSIDVKSRSANRTYNNGRVMILRGKDYDRRSRFPNDWFMVVPPECVEESINLTDQAQKDLMAQWADEFGVDLR